MLVLHNIYDFYEKLSQEEREDYVLDQAEIIEQDGSRYFPIMFQDGNSNYGHNVGLLLLLPVYNNWFKVGAFSPDDLDVDLVFEDEDPFLHDEIAEYLRTMPRFWTSYREALADIQAHFLKGKLWT
jgi:hypothetical protein